MVVYNGFKDTTGQLAQLSGPFLSQLDQSQDVAIGYLGSSVQLVHADEVWCVGVGGDNVGGGVDHLT